MKMKKFILKTIADYLKNQMDRCGDFKNLQLG